MKSRWGAPEPPKLNLHVLLVDDDPMLRRSAKRVLELLGCSSDEAETGRVAVERVREDPKKWDVVLMDLTMPELNGLEAAEQIERLNPKLPIILSSGSSATTKPPDTRHLTLAKPYTFEELEAVLRQVVELLAQR
jgi:CheY-like chemotaxis protein